MFCPRKNADLLMKELLKHGINPIIPPVADLKVGNGLVSDKKGNARLQSWDSIFRASIPDDLMKGSKESAFNFNSRSELSSNQASSFLARLLGVDSGRISASVSNTKAKSVDMKLLAVTRQSLMNLDDVLETFRQLKCAPVGISADQDISIITTVWRAKGLKVSFFDERERKLDMSAEAIEELNIGGDIKFSKSMNDFFAFESKASQVFGVTLRNLTFGKDKTINDWYSDEERRIRGPETKTVGDNFLISDLNEINDDSFISLEVRN